MIRTTPYRILLIEDNPGDVRLVRVMLGKESTLHLQIASTLSEGMGRLEGEAVDVVLVDLGLPDSQGLDTFNRIHGRFPKIPTIVLTGTDDVDLALLAIQAGAQDYLVKGEVSGIALARAARYAIERKRVEEELLHTQRELMLRNRIAEVFLAVTGDESYDAVLAVVLEALQSKYGVIAYLDEEGAAVSPTLTRGVWSECQVPDKGIRFPRESSSNSSGFRAIRERKSNYTNERSAVVPEGHIPIERHVSSPLIDQGEVIGFIQVANKESDYIAEDVALLETLGRSIAPVLNARLQRSRQEAARAVAERSLAAKAADLEQSNRDLVRSESALKEAQRVAHIGHWEWSPVTGQTVWSDEVYRILGIPIGSATPTYELFIGMVEPEDRRALEEQMAEAMQSPGENDIEVDLRITTPNGARLVVSELVFVDRDAAGNVVALHGTMQDISRRVATDKALRDSEAALAEAQAVAHVGSFIFSPQTGEGRGSAEAFRILAIEPAPVVPLRFIFDRIHEDDRARVEAAVASSSQSGTIDVEARFLTPQGIRVVHAVAKRREGDEQRLSLIGTIQDITEQEAAEEALRQRTESLERSNAELERFNRLAVGREMRMIDLKKKINELSAQLGRPAPYPLPDERALAMETT